MGTGWTGWSPIGKLLCRPGSSVIVYDTTDGLDLFTTASDGQIMRISGLDYGRRMPISWYEQGSLANWLPVGKIKIAKGAEVTVASHPGHLDQFFKWHAGRRGVVLDLRQFAFNGLRASVQLAGFREEF